MSYCDALNAAAVSAIHGDTSCIKRDDCVLFVSICDYIIGGKEGSNTHAHA